MNLNLYNTRNYENKSNWTLGENKPNSNPIKPNSQKAKMNITSIITKDYRKNDDFAVRKNKPNSNPISVKAKMNVNLFATKDYENKTAFRPQKNKPKQSQFQRQKNALTPLRNRCVAQEIFKKLLICTCFYSIIVLFYTLYTERHVYQSNMEKVYNAN